MRAGLVARVQDTVPPAEIERAVSLLAGRPKHVVICGGYFSRLIARMLAMQLDQLILNVDYADERAAPTSPSTCGPAATRS
jgi:DNA-binding MurR/RpiR family transcriptional regulator